jgi:transposase
LRARIVLLCAAGEQNKDVAAKLHSHPMTVGKWRRRFLEQRMDGLRDEPRSGAPRTIEDERIEAVIVRTLESQPPNATHWSSRGMSQASGLSVSSVQRIWRAFGLQPHRLETFKLSADPDFVAKVRDVVGLYLSSPHMPWCFVSMRSRKSRRSTARSRCCLCGQGNRLGAAMITRDTAQRHCSPRWTSPPAR